MLKKCSTHQPFYIFPFIRRFAAHQGDVLGELARLSERSESKYLTFYLNPQITHKNYHFLIKVTVYKITKFIKKRINIVERSRFLLKKKTWNLNKLQLFQKIVTKLKSKIVLQENVRFKQNQNHIKSIEIYISKNILFYVFEGSTVLWLKATFVNDTFCCSCHRYWVNFKIFLFLKERRLHFFRNVELFSLSEAICNHNQTCVPTI